MTTGDRPPLSRDVIAATALRLTDEEGLVGLSMRKLGAELGVEAMSLYHYVDSKDDLLDAVLDRLYEEIKLPRDVEDHQWEEAVRRAMAALHQVLLDHPAALELLSSRPAASTVSLDVAHWAYSRFELMGLSPADSMDAFRFAVSFVMGHSANEVGILSRVENPRVPVVLEAASPGLQRFVAQLDERDESSLFTAGVDLVIAGIKARFGLP
jgi:TetR/AcrR family transcriptional regulator, tetracycline repressor protein